MKEADLAWERKKRVIGNTEPPFLTHLVMLEKSRRDDSSHTLKGPPNKIILVKGFVQS